MQHLDFSHLTRRIATVEPVRRVGRVQAIGSNTVLVSGLADLGEIGAEVLIEGPARENHVAEILNIQDGVLRVLPAARPSGIRIGARVTYAGHFSARPDLSWLGRLIGARAESLDGNFLPLGPRELDLSGAPISAAERSELGQRLATGMAVFDTFLPIVDGQRMGLFSGSGVGKSTLIGQLTTSIDTDVAIVALIGERGREVIEFYQSKLTEDGRKKTIIVAATSDKSPLDKRRAARLAVTLAEYFRDQGQRVLLVCDSITRFAEAHRDVALAAGEAPGPSGFPPSTTAEIMALAERCGPGKVGQVAITAIFSVLAEGSDMDGYVPDVVRGVLDGHVILDREIAETGRFPAINLRRSVSRALPEAASVSENQLLGQARKLAADYDQAALMVQSGLYDKGSDPAIDRAIAAHGAIEAFIQTVGVSDIATSFQLLKTELAAFLEPPKSNAQP